MSQAMTGVLLFTHEQSKLIQTEVQTRMRLQTVSLKEQCVGRVDQQAGTAVHSAE